jgi:hypothetical protein
VFSLLAAMSGWGQQQNSNPFGQTYGQPGQGQQQQQQQQQQLQHPFQT